MGVSAEARRVVEDLLAYIEASPSPFHAVAETMRRLEAAGFGRLDERESWRLEPGARHYVTRNDSSIVAFVVGAEAPAEAGFRMVGAHTDSPNLRIKPQGEYEKQGYRQLGVEIYGGVLLASWTDRDLGLSGRVVVDSDGPRTRLLRVDRPLARVPQLAIHLNRAVNDEGLKLNAQQHMPPVCGLVGDEPAFRDWLAAEVGVSSGRDILSFELMFHAVERPTIGGLGGDFIFAPRLDNLASCHAGLGALIAAAAKPVAATRLVAFYDNEEIGSGTNQGAAGSFLEDVLLRLVEKAGGGHEAWTRARARSLMISADMAHAVHPNYADRHDDRHMPRINAGPVVKTNANARYATQAESTAAFIRLCREVEVPVQDFVMRSDLGCGSTIGPLITTRLGVAAVDVGNPMLSMHSAREMGGSRDPELMTRVMTHFYS
ncbi:MAG: M18 family aminopeptidase [Planctomycetes bacterium]|nr:M18 family aminopeptidase [Planctomycetota bacterium]